MYQGCTTLNVHSKLLTTRVIAATPTKITAFAMSIARRNVQLTDERSSSAIERKIRHGKQKFATKVLRPFVSD